MPSMSSCFFVTLFLALNFIGASANQLAYELFDDESKPPVKRVVELLTKMMKELQADADSEAAMYDKMVCWCETNSKEKTASISKGEATIADLQSVIESRSAGFGKLDTEIAAMKTQIAQDTASLERATAIREKEAAEFRSEEQELMQAITNLKNAIEVLSKHQGVQRGLKNRAAASLLQSDQSVITGLRVVLRDLAYKHEMLRDRSTGAAFLDVSRAGGTAQETQESVTGLLFGVLGGRSAVNAAKKELPLQFAERLLEKTARARANPSFLQSQAGQQQPTYQSYAARSNAIFGILTRMLDDFESQLKSSQEDELKASQDYEALAASKKEQIDIGKRKLDDLEEQHADNQKALFDAKEDLDLTTKERAADVEFLRNLKISCNDLDSQWSERSQTRAEELKAVAEAIAILTEDDNHEQMAKGGVSLLQEWDLTRSRSSVAARRAKASEVLRSASRAPMFDADDLLSYWRGRSHGEGGASGPRAQLSSLALSVQLDSFEEVKKTLDKLVVDLKEQQAEEVKFKAYCEKELSETDKAMFQKNKAKKDLETNIESLASLLERLSAEIQEAKDEIAEAELQIKKASQNREKENAMFQTGLADQRATQGILQKALIRLKAFYAPKLTGEGVASNQLVPLKREVEAYAPGTLLVQRTKQTPPAQFNVYSKNAGSVPVIGLLEQIINDSKKLEKELIAAESKAQADYETMVKASNSQISELSKTVRNKVEASAAAKADSGLAQSNLESTVDELNGLSEYEADLHQQCDFILKNFAIRQQARLEEIEAIQEAKGVLSGAAS